MESFIMHPLFLQLRSDQSIICQEVIPELSKYQVYKSSNHTIGDISTNDSTTCAFLLWLGRRRISPVATQICIPNIKQKHIYIVDMVAQYNDDIVFLIVHISDRKCIPSTHEKMLKYCTLIKQQTKTVFKFDPIVYLVNIYANDRISSVCL